MSEQPKPLETDPRFPSGPWVGFFTDPRYPAKFAMELRLTFTGGILTGEGIDFVGFFTLRGSYNVLSGECSWMKQYVRKHDVHYRGFNEGKGIWGTWELKHEGMIAKGGFHIWPEAMADPSQPVLHEEVDLPNEVETPRQEPVLV